ncbi:Uncharacterised protein [Mycobacteroides abscessus subsp. massiliense]|nr:Uncharacterised protein [Mycobacteroides abscessus subsp. massiliense]
MHTVGQTLDGQRLQRRLKHLEVAADRCPAIDNQEQVAELVLAERILRGNLRRQRGQACLALTEVAHRLDPEIAEQQFPGAQHAGNFGDSTPDSVGVHTPRYTADMRQVGQADQGAATEVQAEELNLLGSMGRGGRHDQRPQRRRLSGLGAADDRHVALGTGKIHGQHIAPLFVGPIDQAHRHP